MLLPRGSCLAAGPSRGRPVSGLQLVSKGKQEQTRRRQQKSSTDGAIASCAMASSRRLGLRSISLVTECSVTHLAESSKAQAENYHFKPILSASETLNTRGIKEVSCMTQTLSNKWCQHGH